MAENEDRITPLIGKLEALLQRQEVFLKEINELRREINLLKYSSPKEDPGFKHEIEEVVMAVQPSANTEGDNVRSILNAHREKTKEQQNNAHRAAASPKIKSDLEKFIGENLINKIGIAITVIGVAIGAKYSIEHELISPLTRIILGYLTGLSLLGFGIKLKKNYKNYSAVLVSGAIAILYFITYSAYSFYGLIPQAFAFALMVVFTAFTVIAAINYNQQVIAHIGLVGAYAVPFLLSNGSGNVAVLFTYIAIINVGILFIAFKRYWKPLYYASFILTWLIFYSWFADKFTTAEHFSLSLLFLSVYFATFYGIFLAYKLLKKEKFEQADIILLLTNSFIFYGLGYAILSTDKTGAQLLGAFTVANAIIHFCVSAILYKQKLADRHLFFLVSGLVLVFITIAIPVQLDGNWVTLLWAGEAALLFWLGRTKLIPVYEKLSYILMFLALFSIVHDWLLDYSGYSNHPDDQLTPIFNIHFLTSVLFIVSFVFINYLQRNKQYPAPVLSSRIRTIMAFAIPAILIIAVYYAFRVEISAYWTRRYLASEIVVKNAGQGFSDFFMNIDLMNFKTVWIINYTLLFVALLSFINIKKIKNRNLGLIITGISGFLVLHFLIQGLNVLAELNENYLHPEHAKYYNTGFFNIGIRYISFALLGLLLVSIYKALNRKFIQPVSPHFNITFDFMLHLSVLCVAGSELITWMKIMKFTQSYELGLSILWGVYALLLIALGIWKKKKHLRIGAIALFGVTLIKLFFYDIAGLDTIAKTIVFVSLGVLLLIISFLYNKYKFLISGENES